MTWLRSAAFNLAFFGLTAAMALLCAPLLARPRWTRAALRAWARGVIGLLPIAGIRLSVQGLSHIPPGGVVIASKHQSAFDTLVWFALVPDAAYVLKQELLRIPLYGLYARRAGMIAVDRRGGAAALRRMVREASAAAHAGRQVVIFPEGTRTAPGQRAPLQPGIVGLAVATGVPILPVATDSGRVWARRAFLKRPGVIRILVRPALPATLSRAELLAALSDAIEPEAPDAVDNPVESRNRGVPASIEDQSGSR